MGAVFKARHIRLGRVDALKVIRADKVASKLVAKRFIREIRLTRTSTIRTSLSAWTPARWPATLSRHRVYPRRRPDLHRRRDGPFVADACPRSIKPPWPSSTSTSAGLIHRDLKPSNLMREETTHIVKLLDLGLSNSLSGNPGSDSANGNLTRDGVMLGTPDFMGRSRP